jgi:hypothetical protein
MILKNVRHYGQSSTTVDVADWFNKRGNLVWGSYLIYGEAYMFSRVKKSIKKLIPKAKITQYKKGRRGPIWEITYAGEIRIQFRSKADEAYFLLMINDLTVDMRK